MVLTDSLCQMQSFYLFQSHPKTTWHKSMPSKTPQYHPTETFCYSLWCAIFLFQWISSQLSWLQVCSWWLCVWRLCSELVGHPWAATQAFLSLFFSLLPKDLDPMLIKNPKVAETVTESYMKFQVNYLWYSTEREVKGMIRKRQQITKDINI